MDLFAPARLVLKLIILWLRFMAVRFAQNSTKILAEPSLKPLFQIHIEFSFFSDHN